MKDSYYFQHDYFARNDPKLVEVMMAHGMAGIGTFWCIIEMMYEQGGKLPVASCKSIAFALHVDCNMVDDIFHNYGLFQIDGDFITSKSVAERTEKRNAITETRRNAARKRWADANVMQTDANAQKSDANDVHCIAKIKDKEKDKENIISPKGDKAKRTAFVKPTSDEIKSYLVEKGITNVDAERFFDFYESNGWMVGKNKMKDWRATVRNWSRHDFRTPAAPSRPASSKSSPTPNVNDIWK